MKISSPDQSIRPARFDRPLAGARFGGDISAGWGDPDLERRIADAIDQGRAQGRAEGYAAGWAQGMQAAGERESAETAARGTADEDRRRAEATRLEAVLVELARAAHRLDRAVAPAWTQLADVITDGALGIARAALGRELATLDEPVLDAVRTAVQALAEPAELVLRLNPADHAVVARVTAGQSPLPVAGQSLRLIADPDVLPGEVLAITPAQRLHLSFRLAVAAAEEVLRS